MTPMLFLCLFIYLFIFVIGIHILYKKKKIKKTHLMTSMLFLCLFIYLFIYFCDRSHHISFILVIDKRINKHHYTNV